MKLKECCEINEIKNPDPCDVNNSEYITVFFNMSIINDSITESKIKNNNPEIRIYTELSTCRFDFGVGYLATNFIYIVLLQVQHFKHVSTKQRM